MIPPAMAYVVAIMGKPGYAYGFMIFTILGTLSLIFSIILQRVSK